MKNLAAITIPFAIVIILSAGYTYYQNHHPDELGNDEASCSKDDSNASKDSNGNITCQMDSHMTVHGAKSKTMHISCEDGSDIVDAHMHTTDDACFTDLGPNEQNFKDCADGSVTECGWKFHNWCWQDENAKITSISCQYPPPPVDISKSFLTVIADNAQANGVAKNSVQATINDSDDEPLANITVTFQAINFAIIAGDGTCITDVSGHCAISITNTIVGLTTVSAVVADDKFLSNTVTVTFISTNGVSK